MRVARGVRRAQLASNGRVTGRERGSSARSGREELSACKVGDGVGEREGAVAVMRDSAFWGALAVFWEKRSM